MNSHYTWYTWDCPNCGAENLDSPDCTTAPLCWECAKDFDWWEIDYRGAAKERVLEVWGE